MDFCKWIYSTYILLVIYIEKNEGVAPLYIEPSFLLIEEDFQLLKPLPVSICPGNVKIISGDPTNTFSITPLNSSCSTLRLNKELDADRENWDGSHWESFSIVFSGPRKARATLEVQVVDINDNTPEFINPPTIVSISESAPEHSAITKLRTRDPDTGVAGMARFSVENDLFTVDKRKCNNGECWTILRLKKKLDYEKQSVHQVNIIAEDGDPAANKTNKATHTITIHVIDEQDEPPIFVTNLSQAIILDSSTSTGDEVLVLKAVDGDQMTKKKNNIYYSMDENDFLQVDKLTGSVYLKNKPENDFNLNISIVAQENDSVGMQTKEILQLKSVVMKAVEEQQVSTELCLDSVYRVKIKEGAKDFTQPLRIQLTKNIDPNVLEIEGGLGVFGIDKNDDNMTQEILITVLYPELIDYEKYKNLDFYLSSMTARCRVEVEIIDENDNSPRCAHDAFFFYVTENYRPVVLGKVTATDDDSDLFLPISYTIFGDGAENFAISPNGQLKQVVPADREKRDKYELVIRATDAGGRWTDCPGNIIVKDINDNSPTFKESHYLIEVDEEKSLEQKLEASDPDLDKNGQINYSIDSVPDGLPIHMSSGILFVGKLDRDTMDGNSIDLIIRATDNGTPPRSTTANLTIRVKDINDNWPVFTNSRYSIVLDANISPGGVIGSVKAEDADVTSPNNYVRYTSEDGRFRVMDNGELIFTGKGMLSKDSSTEFRVTAFDGGEPVRNSSAVVIINEHKTSMQSELTTEILGNETKHKTEIKWTNSRMPGYHYEIIKATANGHKDSDVLNWVEIDPTSGAIHTRKALSTNEVKQIKLYISMKKGKREVPVELIIKIVDNSDSTPFFNKDNYKAIISEDVHQGSHLLDVKTSGGDDNSVIRYSLVVLKGPKDVVVIDNDGVIRSKKRLDFETFRSLAGRVIAEDNEGNVAATNFSILLTDANDNRPIFKNHSVFTVYVDESIPIGTIIDLPYPLATDQDSGKNSQLVYFLLGGDGHFDIDPRSSKISLVSKLDFENQRAHSLTLRCVDNGGDDPKNEVFAAATVIVNDVNDNYPVIHNSDLLHLSVSEDSPIGTSITVISVSDSDDGGRQFVSLDANHTMFRVDDKRQVVVAKSLRGYAGERLCSQMVAKDAGNPPLSNSVQYCITVFPASANHHSPLIVFPKPNSIYYFDENIKYKELLRIRLLEEGEMENIAYKLDEKFKKDWEYFAINSSGSLSTHETFDFEKKNVHEIKVLACRAVNCSSVHIFISVNDQNDNCPIFPKQDMLLSLVENDRSSLPRQIGRVPAALDADFHADNTKVCYTTESSLFFFNDPTLPVLYTNSSFDREQKKEYQITVVAYDCLLSCSDPYKSRNDSIIGIITIMDVNDNFPQFSETIYYATVVQAQASPGSYLTTVSAFDPDEEKEGLKYTIKGVVRSGKKSHPSDDLPISIDSATGEVKATNVLREPSYSFTVTVTDNAGHENIASVLISVVTYSQQVELFFDAPFDFIVQNEKDIVRLLSNATSLTAVIDKCRQNSNSTLVLVHFLDSEKKFVDVKYAVNSLMASNSTSRRELRHVYSLREVTPIVVNKQQTLEAVAVGVGIIFLLLLIFCLCLWSRQCNNYDNKLRHITAQAAIHTASLSKEPPQKVIPYYPPPDGKTTKLSGRVMAPPPPLQSTEL